ncbi:MAG TPA: alpha/beta fold hydrolase, partial [Dehalococcoidia bacterium]|nr:alpha/beta fold hydrolase [Dehalococcoidia bacterium]
MEPRIQYAKASDGVNIAYWALGEGPPLVLMPWIPFSHIQLDWRTYPDFYEHLARRRKLIRYDCRGSGLSDRPEDNYSLEAHLLDLEAVIDRLGAGRVALWGFMTSGPLAIAYAAHHPDRVSQLILWCCFSSASDLLGSPQFQGLLALMDKDWQLFTETMASVVFGWSAGEPAREFAEYMRESTSQEILQKELASLVTLDVSDLLPQVTSPTLVLHRQQMGYPSMAAARHLASGIPEARLIVMQGGSSRLGPEDADDVLRIVDDFLNEGGEELPKGTAIILFADIVNSTALTESMGDAAFREKARDLDGALRSAIRENRGTPVEGKLLGDGVLAVFTSARQAIEAALASGRAGESAGLPLHLGLHA